MPLFASALAAIIPILFYLLIIWKIDRFDREPIGLYLKNFLWGAIGAVFFAVIGSSFFSLAFSIIISNEIILNKIETILIAPFVEEITKGIFLLITVTSRKFDNMTDGIVYGGAIGLGFGMTENFLYFSTYGETVGDWVVLVVVRTLFTAVMHCVATATFGAFLGYAKFKPILYKVTFPFIGLAIAMFIHAAWNLSVSFESTTFIGFTFLIASIIIFILVFKLSVAKEKKMIFDELIEESRLGILPEYHVYIIASNERNKSGWIEEEKRKSYLKAATTLAFRKMQLKGSHGFNKFYYQNEVDYHRSIIQNLLSSPIS